MHIDCPASTTPSFAHDLFQLFFSSRLTGHRAVLRNIILLAAISAPRELRVLLADDDEDDRRFFEEAVTEAVSNIRVSTVPDGERLIDTLLVASALPHVVFLDLNMPVKNGWECLQEIRMHPKLKHLPVVIYSTSSNREHIEETYHGGASLYVRKPDTFSELKTMARKVFSLDWK
ncbi:MAG TPA: response regulator, partial [Chitinophagales bacterium]|nr:response regulator [Chitinophagales bacterium]